MSEWIIGFDASTPRCVVVLGRIAEGERQVLVVADERDEDEGGNQASVHLVTRLHAALEQAGIRPSDLAAIACGCGPGTFTGTRVAVSTAKGLAVGLGRPVVPVSTLMALALAAEGSTWVLPLLDARRGEAYGCLVRCAWADAGGIPRVELVEEPRCALASELLQSAIGHAGDERITVVGTGVAPYRDALPESLRETAQPLAGPTAIGLWRACARAFVDGAAIDPAIVEAG